MTKLYDPLSARPGWLYMSLAGMIPNLARVAPLGVNDDIDTATVPEDVHIAASIGVAGGFDHKFIQWPGASAVAMQLVSSDANDTAAGTGCRSVAVSYLDSAGLLKSTTVTMNGTTPVNMPENVLRGNSLRVASVGTYGGTNLGNIDLRASGSLRTFQRIKAGFGVSQSSQYSVPSDKALDILAITFSSDQIDTAQRGVRISVMSQNQLTGVMFKGLQLGLTSTTPFLQTASLEAPIVTIPSGTDVWLRVEDVSANNTYVSAGFLANLR